MAFNIQLLCPMKLISFSGKKISIICLVDKLNIDKSNNEKELFHFGINKKPNFWNINNFVGAASLHISLIKLPKDKFHNKTNLSVDNVIIKSDEEKG